MGEKDARCERSRDTTGRAVGRVRTGRTGPAARGTQGCQIRECTIVDAGGFCKLCRCSGYADVCVDPLVSALRVPGPRQSHVMPRIRSDLAGSRAVQRVAEAMLV